MGFLFLDQNFFTCNVLSLGIKILPREDSLASPFNKEGTMRGYRPEPSELCGHTPRASFPGRDTRKDVIRIAGLGVQTTNTVQRNTKQNQSRCQKLQDTQVWFWFCFHHSYELFGSFPKELKVSWERTQKHFQKGRTYTKTGI